MTTLDLLESIQLLQKSGIKFVPYAVAKNESELQKACKKLKFPLAMKVVSQKISHKTDVGGVKLNIQNVNEAVQAFAKMKKLSGFSGVLLQRMAKGRELIIGGKRDAQFGPVVLFGLGGIFVEVIKDVSMRLCPILPKDAAEMTSEIKGVELLKGTRGQKPVNFKGLQQTLLKVSNLMAKNKKILELDLNPVFANEKEVLAADARVVV